MSVGKKQHIGNKYYLGLHLVPFEKIDAIVEIIAAKKSLWRGYWSGGQIGINQPNHMGGDEKEGGISGLFDLMTGEVSQGLNDYLARLYGSVYSAFRGCVSVVARQPYIGANTGRLPDLGWKGVNVTEIVGDWNPDLARGNVEADVPRARYYIVFDLAGATNIENQRQAIAGLVRGLPVGTPSVIVVFLGATILDTIQRDACTAEDIEEIAVMVEGFPDPAVEESDFDDGVSLAATFFGGIIDPNLAPISLIGPIADLLGRGEARQYDRNVVIFASHGHDSGGSATAAAATLAAIPGVEVYCYFFGTEQTDYEQLSLLDNTPIDGVPSIGTGGIISAFAGAVALRWVDINAIHHIRHLLITKKRGGQATADDIGLSFDVAAQQCYDEGMFLSVPYSKYQSNREAINDIKRHIDAQVFRSSITGKWEVKLIRGDYSFGDLPVLDSSIVTDWSGVDLQQASELPNQVTVTYTKRDVQEPGSVTKTNVAAVRRKGRVIPSDPIDYPLVTYRPLAARLAARDASGISVPALSGTLPLTYLPEGLGLGDAIVLHEPEVRINNVVCRIVEISETDGVDNSASIKVVEDRYTLAEQVLGPDDPVTVPTAQPASPRVIMEAPYYTLVVQEGQADTDAALTETEELGFLFAAAYATDEHTGATVAATTATEYEEVFELGFSPVATLQSSVWRMGETIVIDLNDTLGPVQENDLASIGSEIVRIDAMTVVGNTVEVTIGRGCLDTAPVRHYAGDKILFWGRGEVAEDRYLDGESLDVIVITKVAGGSLPVYQAPVDTVAFSSRAIRPYPPGQFKVNGSYLDGEFYADATLTWVHRDRLQQTTAVPEDHDDATIGPEAGTTYTVRAEAFAGGVSLGVIYTSTGISGTSHDYPDATAYPTGTEYVRLSVASVRDGFESWQAPAINVRVTPVLGVNGDQLAVNGKILGMKG